MDSGWYVDGVPVPLDDCYTDTVTHLRIFDEGDGWALDGADDQGRYTMSIWKFDRHEDAVAAMPEFARCLGEDGYRLMPRGTQMRLEYLRGQIEAECISWGEIAELQSLAEFIDPADVLLLQWAGVPEFEEEE